MKRVRIVDDDISIVELLRVILEEVEGVEPVITGSDFGRLFYPEAWEGIDGALVDCHLKDKITGFDVLGYLKANHPHIRRVAFTAMSLHPDELGDLAMLLEKPGSANQIARLFRD